MFIAAIFRIAKKWKQPKCLSIDEWINKMQYTHTMEYYSCYNMDEPWKHDAKWKKLVTKDNILYDFVGIQCPEYVETVD